MHKNIIHCLCLWLILQYGLFTNEIMRHSMIHSFEHHTFFSLFLSHFNDQCIDNKWKKNSSTFFLQYFHLNHLFMLIFIWLWSFSCAKWKTTPKYSNHSTGSISRYGAKPCFAWSSCCRRCFCVSVNYNDDIYLFFLFILLVTIIAILVII